MSSTYWFGVGLAVELAVRYAIELVRRPVVVMVLLVTGVSSEHACFTAVNIMVRSLAGFEAGIWMVLRQMVQSQPH